MLKVRNLWTTAMSYSDLRQFLRLLEHKQQLKRVAAAVDPELESTSLCLRALRAGGPALLFEHPRGSSIPLLGNLFGSRARIELALSGRPLGSLKELGELLASIKEPRWPSSLKAALESWPELAQLALVAPRKRASAAFQHQVLEHDEVNLNLLPIQRCWPKTWAD